MLAEINWVKSVWTTNFDGLMLKCAHQYNLNPIEITAETSDRVFRQDVDGELLCIALHGDYKYGKLKNTACELDSQNEVFQKALAHEMEKRNLIVVGYSGRDESLMRALEEAYKVPGAGRLYWCGYGSSPNKQVSDLIDAINDSGRCAFYVATDGFDNTLYSLAHHCMGENPDFIRKIENLRTTLASHIKLPLEKFLMASDDPYKFVDTNIFPVAFPNMYYQFEVAYLQNESPWEYCRGLEAAHIMAVPYKGMVYAWGEKDDILKTCSDRLKSDVVMAPFSRDLLKVGAYKELLTKTITALIAETAGFQYKGNKIWNKDKTIFKRILGKQITAYQGCSIRILRGWQFYYIAVSPEIIYDERLNLSHEERKQFADAYLPELNRRTPNLNVFNYVHQWITNAVGKDGIKVTYPPHSSSPFRFVIRSTSGLVGICGKSMFNSALPNWIVSNRIVMKAFECQDPQLEFYNLDQQKLARDFHPMRGLIQNAPVDSVLNQQVLRNSISLGVVCPKIHSTGFSAFLNSLHNRHDVKFNIDYVISFPGFESAYKTVLDIPNVGAVRWEDIAPINNSNQESMALDFCIILTKKIEALSAAGSDVVIIYIPLEYETLTEFSSNGIRYDLHDYIKAYAAQKNIATQFIREKTIKSELSCQIMWALSLAIYVKSCRIPWMISGIQQDTAFAGIGYSVRNSQNGNNIVIGCSHVYSANG